jgi:hypothetical protein
MRVCVIWSRGRGRASVMSRCDAWCEDIRLGCASLFDLMNALCVNKCIILRCSGGSSSPAQMIIMALIRKKCGGRKWRQHNCCFCTRANICLRQASSLRARGIHIAFAIITTFCMCFALQYCVSINACCMQRAWASRNKILSFHAAVWRLRCPSLVYFT